MSQLDKLKEIINTLRGFFAVIIALIVTVTSGLISRYDNKNIDGIFYMGVILDLFMMGMLVFIIRRIVKRTQEMEDL